MRRTLVFLLLAAAASGEHLVEVGSARYAGRPVGLTAIAAGNGYLPAAQMYRSDVRGQFRLLNLAGRSIYESKLGGTSLGMLRHGGGAVIANSFSGEIHFYEYHEGMFTRRERAKYHGAVNIQGFKDVRVLKLGSTQRGPLAILGHAGGLVVATIAPKGQGRTDLIARPGRRYTAVTAPFHADRNGRLDIFAAGQGSSLLHLEQNGTSFRAAGEIPFKLPGLQARAMTGSRRRIWIGGSVGGQAVVAYVAASGARRTAQTPQVVALGSGHISHVELLGPGTLVVAGVKNGRAWVGVIGTAAARPQVQFEKYVQGNAVTALGLNPARIGWSMAVGTSENTVHLLRLPTDKPMPRDWDPFAPPPPPDVEPAPVPPERRTPRDEDVRELPGTDTEIRTLPGGTSRRTGVRPAEGLQAILPRVEADYREQTDTEIVLVYLGDRPTILTMRMVDGSGLAARTVRFRLRPGQRGRISILREFGRRRQRSFDGYVLLEGCRRRDLVVEAVLRKGQATETLRAHWR